MRYVADFGSQNAGGALSVLLFARLDTLAPLTQPPAWEIGGGQWYLDIDWAAYPGVPSIVFKLQVNGVALVDVIENPGVTAVPGAAKRVVLDFGADLVGGAPAWSLFSDLDTLAALAQPAIVEIGFGLFYFDASWTLLPGGVSSIAYKAALAGVEVAGVVSVDTASIGGGATQTPVGFSAAGYLTVGTILNRAAVRLGLGKLGDDPFGSSNPVVESFIEALTQLGLNLLQHNWRHLQREALITTAAGQSTYAWPADFYDLTPQSGWNRSSRLPTLGPLSPQEWQYVQAIQMGVILNTTWRPRGNLIELGPALPAAGTRLAFEYQSRYWLQSASASKPDRDAPGASSDLVLIDGETMIAGVRLSWLEDKGFDTARAQAEFDEKLENALNVNVGGGRILSLSGPRNLNPLILGDTNMPLTGYGI